MFENPENVIFIPEIHGIDTINNVYKNLATVILAVVQHLLTKCTNHTASHHSGVWHIRTRLYAGILFGLSKLGMTNLITDTKGNFLYTT